MCEWNENTNQEIVTRVSYFLYEEIAFISSHFIAGSNEWNFDHEFTMSMNLVHLLLLVNKVFVLFKVKFERERE